jgi:hypothetical protein
MITTQTLSRTPVASPMQPGRPRRVVTVLSQRRVGLVRLIETLLIGAMAYVPLLLVKPGIETSDTKTYLYLDPARFLRQAATTWDPSVALGTVTHQYIGYLFPMGPFYWFFSAIGVPVWVTQRLWLGSILFAAGAGVVYLGRTLNLRAPGRTVAAFAFMLSPYFLQYAGRISVILLPWAGLPFMVALAARALRHGGWKYPALFALVVAMVSGINATAVIYVGVAPLLWLIFAVAILRECSWGAACIAALKMALLTLLCCLWWIAGLVVEAGYGVDVLRYTETLATTASTSSPSQVIRGLGYWYFYGSDRLGPWTKSSVLYTQQLWLVALSYLAPVLAFLSAAVIRWRYRAFFAGLVLAGVVLSVGAYPFQHPTPAGSALKRFMSDTTAGLALRSTDRATPLVVLGIAMLLGAGIAAFRVRLPRLSLILALATLAAVIANNPAIFNGDAEVSSFFTQPAKLPSYERAAIKYLNANRTDTRVLAIPGNNFASYRWGDTVDPPEPAFLDRPFVTREEQVMGSIATANTLSALDDPIQVGTEQWNALAPIAQLLSAGDVLVQYDQRFEHYDTPQPQLLAQQLAVTPSGLADPVSFGTPQPNTPSYRDVDGEDLSNLDGLASPPPLVDYTVNDPRPITRAESDTGALVVAGDATGLEDLAAAGLLDTNSAIFYAGTLDKDPTQLKHLLADNASLVVTDTNRKQAFRWNTLLGDSGFTETPSDNPAKTDPNDFPLNLFPGAPTDAKTTASYGGAIDVTASSYGNPISYAPESDAYGAVDGSLDTSWNTGTFLSNPAGQWWQVKLSDAATADQITVVQPQNGNLSRWITRVTLTFDHGHPVTVNLGPSSRAASGQVITFPTRTFHTLRITIDKTSNDHEPVPAATAVGLAEVQIPGQQIVEVIKMPSDLLSAAGTASINNALTIDMSRQRVSPYLAPYRTDPETTISREFDLPTARTFTLSGSASISTLIPDDEIDRLVGRTTSGDSTVTAYSEGRLPGDAEATASAAADGNLTTAWQPGSGAAYQKGEWLEYDVNKSVTFDHLDLQVVADGRHSVPTSLQISTENGTRSVQLPPITDQHTLGATVSVPVSFPAISGRHIRITVTGVRIESATNFDSTTPVGLPLAIAEVGIPGVQVGPDPATLPGKCVSNLITIDGNPISVKVVGSTATALDDGEVSVVPCGADAAGITLGPGSHVIQTAPGHAPFTGWNLDQLVLGSAAGGGPATAAPFGSLAATQPGPAPAVTVTHQSTTSESLTVAGATQPFELVLGQSVNAGWRAVASPSSPSTHRGALHSVNLGPPQLVDGFANGWQVTAADLRALGAGGGGPFTVALEWTPQQRVWVALVVSGVTILVCVILGFVPVRRLLRRRRRNAANDPSTRDSVAAPRDGREDLPILSSPLSDHGARPRIYAIPIVAILTGAGAAAFVSLRVGLVVGVATLVALSLRWLRTVLTLASVGFLAAAATIIVIAQVHHTAAHNANLFVWVAVVALAADAVVVVTRQRRRERQQRQQSE